MSAAQPRGSLLLASAGVRISGALGLIALLWVTVAWALGAGP